MHKKIYFYIPGAESLNVLYFLAEQYGENLAVITPSISVKKVCEIIGLNYLTPTFCNSSDKAGEVAVLKYFKNVRYLAFLNKAICKAHDLFNMILKLVQAKKMVGSIMPGSVLYYSTFFFDVPGILFLGSAIKSKKISIKLIWPSNVRFNETIQPSAFTVAFFLNVLTSNLFVFHSYPSGGRIIGVNPGYLRARKIYFFHESEETKCALPEKYIKKAFSLLDIKFTSRPRVLFLGEYSVENGVAAYGSVYLKLLSLLGNMEMFDTYYKPHPLYHSIRHPSLNNLRILDTQIPVEFLDDGSWSYIIAFHTASLMTRKASKCICLLALEELDTKIFDQVKLLKLMEKSANQLVYPKNLNALKLLLRNCTP
jgi:hypothetical protein